MGNRIARSFPGVRLAASILAVLLCVNHAQAAQAQESAGNDLAYSLDYTATLVPSEGIARVRIQLRQPRNLLRSARFRIDPKRYRDFAGDGEVKVESGRVTWLPPKTGGSLSYSVSLQEQKKSGSYDSMIQSRWALFRGDDLVPAASVRTVKGAYSRSRLRLSGPTGWSFLTAYPKDEKGWFEVVWPDRGFDRPVGWMIAGKLTVKWTDVQGVRLAIAGPLGQGVRSMDLLAFLRWTLPSLLQIFPNFPERILIVSAGDPMFRGGLSAPNSLFLHADRPLISGNGTSTLLHELMHIAQGYSAEGGDDWIVEGIAEYYTLEILHRSGTLSGSRYEKGLEKLEAWGEDIKDMESERSSGARTARAVGIMQNLDAELRGASKDVYSLDDVARRLSVDSKPVTLARLRQVCEDLIGKPVESLADKRVKRP